MGKKTKVVIDNNVLVSAFGWRGKPEEKRLPAEDFIRNILPLTYPARLRTDPL